ncbi:DUF427 domain-containing protein [Rhizorhabdus dicambivorans]|uniref:DUF427 domain-containing protein n=1 Tax=Rhizorhabdus dicambivorans TaxID=1850238 RepID=A0A2A4FQU7_9SPHN|nr:DUF427 domain-containing protein [Rhizorhabdus dicambivorans]ATE65692.1 DUF427 domain-containing protein [Rhizorhabdus dicambivorans]PCE40056.1 DUF427 domain-containing protein [Rhizorhabdus dicambivorans]
MTDPLILAPSADHPITIRPNPRRVVVEAGGQVVADSCEALILHEASYPAVQYIPLKHVMMASLRPSTHSTYCLYKGTAAYFDLLPLGDRGANAVWTYLSPYSVAGAIADHVAFYADRVEIRELECRS